MAAVPRTPPPVPATGGGVAHRLLTYAATVAVGILLVNLVVGIPTRLVGLAAVICITYIATGWKRDTHPPTPPTP